MREDDYISPFPISTSYSKSNHAPSATKSSLFVNRPPTPIIHAMDPFYRYLYKRYPFQSVFSPSILPQLLTSPAHSAHD